jgi:hypothetical protein
MKNVSKLSCWEFYLRKTDKILNILMTFVSFSVD